VADFFREDLQGSRFERVDLSGAQFRTVDLSGATFRGVYLQSVKMRGVELVEVDINAEIEKVTIDEESEHRLYAERDLAVLESRT
jgi:uncharacterized protein YjbI with pentapeptide repeats